jgi:hypothetical protein
METFFSMALKSVNPLKKNLEKTTQIDKPNKLHKVLELAGLVHLLHLYTQKNLHYNVVGQALQPL